jgi:hypothetical protein
VSGKMRTRGDWEGVARSRKNKAYEMRSTRGLTNVPSVTETGSAAYRRMQAKVVLPSSRTRHHRGEEV